MRQHPRAVSHAGFNAPVTQANRAEVRTPGRCHLDAKISSQNMLRLPRADYWDTSDYWTCISMCCFPIPGCLRKRVRGMVQRDNRCSCKKNERTFLCQTVSSSWVLGAFWVYYKMGILKLITQSGFGFFKLLRGPRSLFLVYKLGLKKWLKTAFENHFDEKNQPCFNQCSALIL